MRGMKEEMDKLRASAADRERLSMTAQSLEDRLKERETQVKDEEAIVVHSSSVSAARFKSQNNFFFVRVGLASIVGETQASDK